MKPRLIYKKRSNHSSRGFELVRLYENGNVLQKKYKHSYTKYQETDSKTFHVKGTIVLEEIHFDKDNKRKTTELLNHVKELKTFKEKEYEKAHKELTKLHEETEANLSVDYRLMFVLDTSSLTEEIEIPKEVKTYPITFLRATTSVSVIERKKNPENLAIRFVPIINENLYFHYIPNNDHITMTGDNLFALATRNVDKKLSEQEFVDYVDGMVEEVKDKEEYYVSLIKSQRQRIAALETKEMGDLYPR
ncbi:MAG: hypothetical protein K9L74_02545 [Candidatus Izimaplasma sp.]|nr:hypothetical protein [Candidatus Izimaplasma bacterium]